MRDEHLPGTRTVASDWKGMSQVRNVLRYVHDGYEVVLYDEETDPFAVIVPIEKYRKMVSR